MTTLIFLSSQEIISIVKCGNYFTQILNLTILKSVKKTAVFLL